MYARLLQYLMICGGKPRLLIIQFNFKPTLKLETPDLTFLRDTSQSSELFSLPEFFFNLKLCSTAVGELGSSCSLTNNDICSIHCGGGEKPCFLVGYKRIAVRFQEINCEEPSAKTRNIDSSCAAFMHMLTFLFFIYFFCTLCR